jgi:TonB family protein
LPNIDPSDRKSDPRPPKAEHKANQNIVSHSENAPAGKQTVWLPEPKLESPVDLQSPNLLAFSQPAKPVRAFTLPPVKRVPKPADQPDAPPNAASLVEPPPVAPAPAKPVRPFTPPKRSKLRESSLPDIPEIAPEVDAKSPIESVTAKPVRAFTAPTATAMKAEPLPAAPEMTASMNLNAAPVPNPALTVKPGPRTFIPPERARLGRQSPSAVLPAAPEIRASVSNASAKAAALAGIAQPAARPGGRTFTPPAARAATSKGTVLPQAPELRASASGLPSAAIVGLNPVATATVPQPSAPRRAEFSAGPELRKDGGTGGSGQASISVPGLLVRGGSKEPPPAAALVARVLEPVTSSRNLQEAIHDAPLPKEVPPEGPQEGKAVRVAVAPDPRLRNRAVYATVVQMPNITSYSGSWMIWFAERNPGHGNGTGLSSPIPLRKVDPKYASAAMDERIEGKVRMAAVIRKTGMVDSVELLRGLDPRLDSSAIEALGKWEFEPAMRDGVPLDIDVVVEIPFKLEPLAKKKKK